MPKRVGRTLLLLVWVAIGVGFIIGHGGLLLAILGVVLVVSGLGDLVRVLKPRCM